MKYPALSLILLASIFLRSGQTSDSAPSTKQPTIDIGIALHLGEPRDSVISKLATSYQVVKIKNAGDDWLVQEKDASRTNLGSLGFANGKLTYAAKDWTQGNEDNHAFAQALRGAMAQMASEGHNTCYFDTPSSRSPTAESSYLRFYCGPKRVDVVIIDVLNGDAKGHYVSITEVLSSEKGR